MLSEESDSQSTIMSLSERTVMSVLINNRVYTETEPDNDANGGYCDA